MTQPPYLNPALPLDARADDLVGRMTLEQTVRFTLGPAELALVNDAGQRVVEAGEYRVSVGGGQPTAAVSAVSGVFRVLARA